MKFLFAIDEQRHARQQHEHRDTRHDRTVRHRPFEQPRVERIDGVEDPRILRRVLVLAVRIDLQPSRRQHRRQREADEQRHHDRERHRQAEALHEAADDAAHEADRDEDRDQRQRRREHGEADLLGRLHRRRWNWILVLLLDEPVDVLEHDDRVVDDDADRQRQREHRHHVEREAHVPDQPEGRDDRGRNGDRRDDRRPQVRQEEQHDERRENRPEDEVLLDVVRSPLR